MLNFDISRINWEKMDNRVPVIVQDIMTGNILMLAYMNQEALNQTLATKKVAFYSRSKQRLWTKGETSGNYLNLDHLSYDCDADCLLALVKPEGPVCHKGTATCFAAAPVPRWGPDPDWEVLKKLEDIIQERSQKNPANSYTAALLRDGFDRIAQKVGEEAVEVVIAALGENKKALSSEAADLLFHLLVLLQARDLSIADVIAVLKNRMA